MQVALGGPGAIRPPPPPPPPPPLPRPHEEEEEVLPPGWTATRLEGHSSKLYLHVGSRVVLMTRPHAAPSRDARELPLPPLTDSERALVDALSASIQLPQNRLPEVVSHHHEAEKAPALVEPFHVEVNNRRVDIPRIWSPEEMAAPRKMATLSPEVFAYSLNRSIPPTEAVIAFLRAYCWLVMGTIAELRQMPAEWVEEHQAIVEKTSAAGPPMLAECHVEGLCVGRALQDHRLASAAAAEDALLRLCPLRWEAELKHPDIWPTVVSQGGRLIPHTVLDVDLLGTLSVDDDRILNLDASIAKPPSLVLLEFTAQSPEKLRPSSTYEVDMRKLPWVPNQDKCKVFRCTTRLGRHIGSAEHVNRRRAQQASMLELLRAAHPDIKLWKVILEQYFAKPSPEASDRAANRGPVRFDKADRLLEADLVSQKSNTTLELEAGASSVEHGENHRRSGLASLAGSEEGTLAEKQSSRPRSTMVTVNAPADIVMGDRLGYDADKESSLVANRQRMLPGKDADFVTKWQSQYEIEAICRKRIEAGVDIRELADIRAREDENVRKRLRHTMAQLDAIGASSEVEHIEQTALVRMRRGEDLFGPIEPSALGGRAPSDAAGSVEDQIVSEQHAKKLKRLWAPWKHGTKGHAALQQIAVQHSVTPVGASTSATKGEGRSGELYFLR